MKLKQIIFLMVFSMLFIACDEEKPKADTYALSGQFDLDDIGGVTINNTPVYVRIYSTSVSLTGICETSETPLYTKTSQFNGTTDWLNYEVTGIPAGTYNFCVLVDSGSGNVGSFGNGDAYHANSISISANTTYDISGEAWSVVSIVAVD